MAQVYYQKAAKAGKSGKDSEAEDDLKRAVALDPDSVICLIALARLRHKAGSFSEAESLLSAGLERSRDDDSRREISAARERLKQTEVILSKLRKEGV
jgi:thioredoxin-like negative regulator of GroEL